MKEWLWMDYPQDGGNSKGGSLDPIVENVEKIKDSEWDYYSGLPNPTWYENTQ